MSSKSIDKIIRRAKQGKRLADSRKGKLPDFVFLPEFRSMLLKASSSALVYSLDVNKHQDASELPTLPTSVVLSAGKIMGETLSKFEKSEWKILEIMAGNCCGSRLLFGSTRKIIPIFQWICTDIIDYKKTIKEPEIHFEKLDGIDSVSKYFDSVDVLVMMCPPPSYVMYDNKVNPLCLCDFYPIIDWIAMAKKVHVNKFIVYIGELGGSDGTEGMYIFMLNNPDLILECRQMLITGHNQFGIIEKEIFIFRVKND